MRKSYEIDNFNKFRGQRGSQGLQVYNEKKSNKQSFYNSNNPKTSMHKTQIPIYSDQRIQTEPANNDKRKPPKSMTKKAEGGKHIINHNLQFQLNHVNKGTRNYAKKGMDPGGNKKNISINLQSDSREPGQQMQHIKTISVQFKNKFNESQKRILNLQQQKQKLTIKPIGSQVNLQSSSAKIQR